MASMLRKIFNVLVFLFFIPSLCFGAVVHGTSAGFVTSAPSDDPSGSVSTIDGRSFAYQDTSPSGSNQIISMGWWCDTASEESNFEMGVYSHDAGNNVPNILLASNKTNAKGTTKSWKTSAVSYTLSASTVYWLAIQLDDCTTLTSTDYTTDAGHRLSYMNSQTTLASPWVSGGTTTHIYAIYAVWEAVATGTSPLSQILGTNSW